MARRIVVMLLTAKTEAHSRSKKPHPSAQHPNQLQLTMDRVWDADRVSGLQAATTRRFRLY